MRLWQVSLTVSVILGAGALGALVYGQAAAGGGATGAARAGLAAETLGEFTPLDVPRPAPDVSFSTRDGETLRLRDFRGHVVLVNLWATWCAPCVQEMPSLDRLQAKLGDDLTILAISEDRRGAAAVDPFMTRVGLKSLATYLDPDTKATHAFGVDALPTSFLIDRDGRILGYLEGGAQWDSAAMVALLRRYATPSDPLQRASAVGGQ
jgi:thiol-disulfide isomerase/thioredoxin